ncbi:MAG: 1-deoxy-D-xylulose-5-phosphate reductoisomerase [Trueperella sp.]|nr:1-deoxy-D-xylulose-5-phosphate reductoisomerase [Trueperella sp.]
MRVVILGSTGSIGTQALNVIRNHPDKFEVVGLGAGGNQLELLAAQTQEFRVSTVAVANQDSAPALKELLPGVAVWAGSEALAELAALAGPGGVVLNGITGSVGLGPTLAALHSGAQLALANKESLVAGGKLVADAMVRPGQITPVDSEHSAIAQALRSGRHHKGLTSPEVDGTSEVARLILTASGGPFRGCTRAQLQDVTAQQALNHPTWDMGPVVTINSATLMNKGLELIEAAYLFDMSPQQIVPVVHPQSVIHSMVEFCDGSTIAQASPPDMQLPIALGLSWPDRLPKVATPCRWDTATSWDFEPLDDAVFPAVNLAREAVATSALHPAVMNAANEEAVAAFLTDRISYLAIIDIVSQVVADFSAPETVDLAQVQAAEAWARHRAQAEIAKAGK